MSKKIRERTIFSAFCQHLFFKVFVRKVRTLKSENEKLTKFDDFDDVRPAEFNPETVVLHEGLARKTLGLAKNLPRSGATREIYDFLTKVNPNIRKYIEKKLVHMRVIAQISVEIHLTCAFLLNYILG